ncbi:MAG: putative zinc-binding protein [Candidatus Thorarchaeota archaeon]
MTSADKIVILPCSGIGKAFGSVAREATYMLTEHEHHDKYRTLCLALLMAEDEHSVETVRTSRVITIDGCPKKCATVCAKRVGSNVVKEILLPRVLAANREHSPGTVLDIGEGGVLLARDVVREILPEGNQ